MASIDDDVNGWLKGLGYETTSVALNAPDWQEWMRQVFVEHGPLNGDDLSSKVTLRMIEGARAASRLVQRDIEATLGRDRSVSVIEEDGIVFVSLDQYVVWNDPLTSIGAEQLIVDVADRIQEAVMEGHWRVWPECTRHHLGLHPTMVEDEPVWWCRRYAHHVARIGELPHGTTPSTTDSSKARRSTR